jgi:predicted Kef-type K+ transport protein
MDLAPILAAFALGFGAARVGLPPLVGFLAAGFLLHAGGYETNTAIETISDIGVLLLLFGIGLKLRLRTLARPEVWAVAGVHMVAMTVLTGVAFLAFAGLLSTSITLPEAALLGFAFSFSSTVFAVKALEERNETASLAGRLAIGILIMQDIVAVTFLALSADQVPSLWAIPVVLALVAARPVWGWFLDHSGHGELQVLFGFALAVGVGAGAFEIVGLKPDLGALLVGIILSGHPKAHELADRLLSLKDILLIGFFLSIGLGGAPSPTALVGAVIVLLLLPVKSVLYVTLLARFRLRARTSLHASLTLSNYSEFGLIVATVAAEQAMLDQVWVSALAVAVSLSFLVAAPANSRRYDIYGRWRQTLIRLERHPSHPDDALIDPGPARMLVFGLGRVGQGAVVVGIDRDGDVVADSVRAGRPAVRGDALDRDFWERISLHDDLELIVLAMNEHPANVEAASRIRAYRPDIHIAANARYADQVTELIAVGVDVARNLYSEAGQGLADDASIQLTSDD